MRATTLGRPMHRLVLPSAFCAWLSTEFLGLGEPASEIGGDKVIVNEPRIGMGYAGNLGGLTGGESFVRVEARGGGEEALAAERFVDARETAGKLMGEPACRPPGCRDRVVPAIGQ